MLNKLPEFDPMIPIYGENQEPAKEKVFGISVSMNTNKTNFMKYLKQFDLIEQLDDVLEPASSKSSTMMSSLSGMNLKAKGDMKDVSALSDDRIKVVTKNLFGIASDEPLLFSNDITFYVGKKNKSKVFKKKDLVAAVKSPAFKSLFTSKSGDVNSKKKIELPEIEPNVFITLLKYIYCNEVDFELKDLVSTYQAAIKYEVDDLPAKLLAYADENVNIDTAAILYDQYLKLASISNDLISSTKLDELIDIINLHTFLVIQSSCFPEISQDTLIKILESDKLFVKEKDLYYASIDWIKAELKRKDQEDNLDNRRKLFNEIKHLIRFPIMNHFEFAEAKRTDDYAFRDEDKNEDKYEKNPAKSGLLTDDEVEMLEKYIKTKDSSVLKGDFKTSERCKQNIGLLELIFDKEKERFVFEMTKNVDDLLCKNLKDGFSQRKDCGCESYYDDYGTFYDGVILGTNYERIKPKKLTKELLSEIRNKSMICNEESIKVFRIDVTGSSSGFDYGSQLMVFENDKVVPTFYKRYCLDKFYGYYSYLYPIELKKDAIYNLGMITPGEGDSLTVNKIKLENIYTTKEGSDEKEIDVRCEIRDRFGWEHATRLFFIYK